MLSQSLYVHVRET